MPVYRYKAVNNVGEVAAGELDATSESEIVERLRDQGLMPMQVLAATGERSSGAPKPIQRRSWVAPPRGTPGNRVRVTPGAAPLLGAGPAPRPRPRIPINPLAFPP